MIIANQIASNNIHYLKQEIVELCKVVLLFEKHVQEHRVKVFGEKGIDDDGIWNYVFGSRIQRGSKNELYIFMHKHHSKPVIEDCQLICKRYSQTRDGLLNKADLWQIFKPKTQKLVKTILQMKKSKSMLPKTFLPKDEIQKEIILILQKTIQYEKHAKLMKCNIVKHEEQFRRVTLKQVDAKYLQLYLRQYINDLRISQCQILLKHMIGSKVNKEKFFYIFFFPQQQSHPSTNPIQKCNSTEKSPQTSLELYSKSKTIWQFGSNYKDHNKPLYMI